MRRAVLIVVLLAAAGAGVWFANRHSATLEAARLHATPDPVPVLAASSEQRDVPIYLDGLGTVQAFNSVAVKPMVEGPLVEIRFREGQDVRVGDVLARIDPRPLQAALDQALAKKQQDDANLANVRVDANRYSKLAATAYSSAQQSDTARAQVAQLEAQARQDQAQIDSARTQLGYTTIIAAFDGRTGLRQVDIGNIVHPSDTTPLTVITQLRPISVVFTLPQQSLPAVASALQAGSPEVLALSQGAVLDRGTLAVLDNQIDAATGTIKLKATFPNADLRLWPGGFVNVRLLAETKRSVITVSTAAVQRGPQGAYVYIVNADDTVSRRRVELGHEDEMLAVIADGVALGERVVVDGAGRLTDGAKVAVAGSDGNAPAASPVIGERRGPAGHRRSGGA